MVNRDRNVKILKYLVHIKDVFSIDLPKDAKILSVQVQHGVPQLWAVVDTKKEKVKWDFYLVSTGNEMPTNAGTYIGTFQLHEGNIVFHLFQSKQSPGKALG